MEWNIDENEKDIARFCIDCSKNKGAEKIRVTLNKSVLDQYTVLNGETDKVYHSADRSVTMAIFADNRYGTFSTNNFNRDNLEKFMENAIETVKMLAEDNCRDLPPEDKICKNAINGNELGLYDEKYHSLTDSERLDFALGISKYKSFNHCEYHPVSEEISYVDSIFDNYILDSSGTECRHIETSFEASVEITIQDKNNNKYSGFAWESSCRNDLKTDTLSADALERAVRQINPVSLKGGKYNMVIENEVAYKIVQPVLSALNGYKLQQHNSFLKDKLNTKVFHEGFTLTDSPAEYGQNGCRLYDSEGVAYTCTQVIEKGVIKRYFINTYIANKMGLEQTNEDCCRPVIQPFGPGSENSRFGIGELLEITKKGILVTGFNGGNCNSGTGDFSYGIEGFYFEGGKILYPVKDMVITGNLLNLWNNLVAAGSDYKNGMSRRIPSLAFENIDFSG